MAEAPRRSRLGVRPVSHDGVTRIGLNILHPGRDRDHVYSRSTCIATRLSWYRSSRRAPQLREAATNQGRRGDEHTSNVDNGADATRR